MTLLIISNSFDASTYITSDLAEKLGHEVFLLHTDLLGSYKIRLDLNEFTIEDPSGRILRSGDISACYWRKPWLGGDEPENTFPETERKFVRAQLAAIVWEIVGICREKRVVRLVEPAADRRLTKFAQMRIARQFFRVPGSVATFGATITPEFEVVAKTLVAEQVHTSPERFLFTTVVWCEELDPGYPWFIQERIYGDFDITIVYVAGIIFPFRVLRPRTVGPTDWRQNINTDNEDTWITAQLTDAEQVAIGKFMRAANLYFGRLDFIRDGRELIFLEVNSNGQYAWLDKVEPYQIHHAVLDSLYDDACSIAR